eukprot:CAMPEP_0172183312 /NCGR_PEP_ID=MMETSP1050-20130122/18913_1 /TAXON_ID=233186 /ORGANISM="Cryptomonas curvata, Strain CCAP979/52" /LENGTH=333 /DNA_ID=CAMNT_0012856911 /DNA_START=251 /DNA_END=1252 /DNA_ORIENTATION=-
MNVNQNPPGLGLVVSFQAEAQQLPSRKLLYVTPQNKQSGNASIVITATAQSQTTGAEITASVKIFITVLPLLPVFDDLPSNPLKSVGDIKTMVGTPTYPLAFLVGHEDPALLSSLQLRASSPDLSLIQPSGISLSLATQPPSTFDYNQIVVPARQALVTLQPSAQGTGTASLTYILTDGTTTVRSTVSFYIIARPAQDRFCAYDALADDTLASVADLYGMHWMTLFLLNNHSVAHPDTLTAGTRLSVGRPYLVRDGDSLYSIATRYGTTWQRIASPALNPAMVLSTAPLRLAPLFAGQLLCVPPDLVFVACCSHRQYGVSTASSYCADAAVGT